MIKHAVTTLAVTIALSACVFTGYNEDGDTCVGAVGPVGLLTMPGRAPSEMRCSPSRIVDVKESSKHVKYSSAQRVLIAEKAARLMYPVEEHRFRLANLAASIMVGPIYGYDYKENLDCSEMAAIKDLALKLQNKVPVDAAYREVANRWDHDYSDEQLDLILLSAQERPHESDARKMLRHLESLNKDLRPQHGIIMHPYESMKAFADANRTVYMPQTEKYRLSQSTFPANATCKKNVTNYFTQQYTVVRKQ